MKITIVSVIAVMMFACGCRNPGIVKLSSDTYMLSKSSAAGMFANLPKLKAEVIHEANAFAESKGKIAIPVSSHDTFPTHGFPSYEYQFRLVDRNDPEAGKAAGVSQTDGREVQNPTIGQQLIDLQKAKDAGAITETEYQTQRAKLLGKK